MVHDMIQKYLTDNPSITFIKHVNKTFTNIYSTKKIHEFINSKIVIEEDSNRIACINKIILDNSNKNIKGIALFMVKDTINIDHLTYDYDELQSKHQVQLIYKFNIEYLIVYNTINNNKNLNKLILPHIYDQFVPSLINMHDRNYKFIFILDTDIAYQDYLMIKYLNSNNRLEISRFICSSHDYLTRRIVTHSYTLSELNNTIPIESGMSFSYMVITTSKFTSDQMRISININTDNDITINQHLLPSELDDEYDLSSCKFDTYIYDGHCNIKQFEQNKNQATSNVFIKDNSVIHINIDTLININVNVTYVMYDMLRIHHSHVNLLYKHSTLI